MSKEESTAIKLQAIVDRLSDVLDFRNDYSIIKSDLDE